MRVRSLDAVAATTSAIDRTTDSPRSLAHRFLPWRRSVVPFGAARPCGRHPWEQQTEKQTGKHRIPHYTHTTPTTKKSQARPPPRTPPAPPCATQPNQQVREIRTPRAQSARRPCQSRPQQAREPQYAALELETILLGRAHSGAARRSIRNIRRRCATCLRALSRRR